MESLLDDQPSLPSAIKTNYMTCGLLVLTCGSDIMQLWLSSGHTNPPVEQKTFCLHGYASNLNLHYPAYMAVLHFNWDLLLFHLTEEVPACRFQSSCLIDHRSAEYAIQLTHKHRIPSILGEFHVVDLARMVT